MIASRLFAPPLKATTSDSTSVQVEVTYGTFVVPGSEPEVWMPAAPQRCTTMRGLWCGFGGERAPERAAPHLLAATDNRGLFPEMPTGLASCSEAVGMLRDKLVMAGVYSASAAFPVACNSASPALGPHLASLTGPWREASSRRGGTVRGLDA